MPTRLPGLRRLRRLGLSSLLVLTMGSGLVPALAPLPVQASTADTMEDHLLTWINQSRASLGLKPLRSDPRLRDLAGYRAGVMAATNTLNHTVAGCLSCELTARGIQWYSRGEVIAATTYAYGDPAALSMFNWWKSSPYHWPLLMSATYNYIGVGIAYRSANASSWGSIVLTESVDHTSPWARMRYGWHSGTTVGWAWTGADRVLQTHTSGLRNYDVQYRVGYGTWVTIRSWTTTTYLTLYGRAHGHYYGLRVRSRDWRGYVSGWTAEVRVWVP
jgi:uncharacterized protein YkwD